MPAPSAEQLDDRGNAFDLERNRDLFANGPWHGGHHGDALLF
jgi:hypothetical protein